MPRVKLIKAYRFKQWDGSYFDTPRDMTYQNAASRLATYMYDAYSQENLGTTIEALRRLHDAFPEIYDEILENLATRNHDT
jgi:hypothetical protein